MKKLITVILVLISFQVHSQIKIGLNVRPEISFANSEIHWTSISYGLASNFNIYKWVSINVGIGYQSKNYDLTMMPFTTEQVPITSYLLHTLPIYLMPKVNIIKLGRNFQFYGIAGVTMNTCIYEKATYAEENFRTETSSKICFYNLLFNIGLGLDYTISKFSLFVEPAFNTIVARNLNYYQPYSNTISFNIGCFYSLTNNK
jgi:hypothetical protein